MNGSRTCCPHGGGQAGQIGRKRVESRAPELARSVKKPGGMKRRPHPFEHHPAFRAVIAAAPPVAELAQQMREDGRELVGTLVLACGDLASGFAAAPGTRARNEAHHRAWTAVRELDRSVTAARINRRAPASVLARAQRAIDRADVMIAALPGVVAG